MSLTNPNTPVSQQDLQDFYHKLLPYMGGSFGMIANKFSKGDMYSTNEKMIGQWIDGKPLYQRTVTGTTPSNNTQVEYQTGWTNIENMFIVNGYMVNNYGNNTAINFADTSTNTYVFCNVKPDGTKYYIGCKGDWMYNRPFVITFQYTKTTDSAISIGSDTDYSTEEKIIGTWIDGKPVYQKTLENIGISLSWSEQRFAYAVTDTSLIQNVDNIVGIAEIVMANNSATPIQYVYAFANIQINNDGKWVIFSLHAGYPIVRMTVRYTKTAD